ncbi:MAG: type 4a pilus biogenesis protein PilO [Candidatus Omnitrophota bacterium]
MALDKKKLLLVGIFVLIFLYLDVSFVIMAQVKGLSDSGSRIAKLQTDIDKLNRDLNVMQSQKQKEKGLQGKQRQLVISGGGVSLFLEKMQSLANDNGVAIAQIKQAGAVVEGALAKSSVQPLKISVELSGTYHALGKFINSLENSDVFVNVDSLKILLSPTDIFRQNLNLSLIVYVKK